LDVVREASATGLDLLIIPAHTSHALQPLDVSVFKPFKQHFRENRDFWSSRNLNESATKDTLAQWVSLALRKVLSASNIKKGLSATCIFPVHARAVDSQMLPSQVFESLDGEQHSQPGQGDTDMHTEIHCGEEEQGIHREGERCEENAPPTEAHNLEADFAEVPHSTAEHFCGC
jgi:hypothetical protein